MGFFGKLFGGQKEVGEQKRKSGFELLKIASIDRLTQDSVKVTFDVPEELESAYSFIPGQYINLIIELNGNEYRRSYSICSGVDEKLAIGVKTVEGGKVSTWLNTEAKSGDEIRVGYPEGNFTLSKLEGNYVAFAAGSGITPLLSIAKLIHKSQNSKLILFYSNKNEESIMFKNELDNLDSGRVEVRYLLSRQEKEGYIQGRLDAENIIDTIKSELELLKSKGFYLCGPEEMILNASEGLKSFGVPEEKIHYELFTTPTLLKSKKKETVAAFNGVAKITLILDDEEENFELEADGPTILDEAESYGIDAPFSCRGGVCCTCRAKVLKGAASMDKNYSLTDKEIEEGYILTCQAHPNSKELTITYDE
ncbi:MAG: 2Fe-2S iron-sulfur cluster-binding protein [Brumimicrobium sp.]|nr:2Fe-2S iron-sulfur cluster-binding protein [Brumimicrobium sp.]